MPVMPDLKRDLVDAAARLSEPRRRLHVLAGVAAAVLAAAGLAAGTVLLVQGEGPERTPLTPVPGQDPPSRGLPPGWDPSEPRPDVHPVPGSNSASVDFGFAGARYSIVGFRSGASICTALTGRDTAPTPAPGGRACLAERLLRRALAARPFHTFGGGGGDPTFTVGFARAAVVGMSVSARRPMRVVLSKPWRPEPWQGSPIRFFYVLADTPPDVDPGDPSLWRGLRIAARLKDGAVVRSDP